MSWIGIGRALSLLSSVGKTSPKDIINSSEGLVEKTADKIAKDAPFDTGELRNSVNVVKSNDTIEIQVTADHADEVEYGTRYQRPQPFFQQNIQELINELPDEVVKDLKNKI